MVFEIIFYVLFALFVFYLMNQVRKPSRWTGRLFTSLMNKSHSELTDWGLSHITVDKGFTILDVGCGGGRTIEKLAEKTVEGKVFGVDYANGSVAAARSTNARSIADGRVAIEQASVSKLPFPDDKFDLVTAVETQYYWPDPESDMREVFRVVRPGGTFAVIAESYAGGRNNWVQAPIMWMLRSKSLTAKQNMALFEAAGFTDVQVFEETKEGWICITGKKAASADDGQN